VVPRCLGSAKGYFLVECAESLNFHLSLGETCLHLLIRLLQVHDVVGSYRIGGQNHCHSAISQAQTSFQKGDLAALLVGDGQDIFQPSISVAKFVSAALFRFDALPSGGLLPGVGKVFCEGDAYHLIFFVRDGATAIATTRGTSGGGGRVVSYRASVGKAVTAARGGGSCGRV
jgi:hypothetical protein